MEEDKQPMFQTACRMCGKNIEYPENCMSTAWMPHQSGLCWPCHQQDYTQKFYTRQLTAYQEAYTPQSSVVHPVVLLTALVAVVMLLSVLVLGGR